MVEVEDITTRYIIIRSIYTILIIASTILYMLGGILLLIISVNYGTVVAFITQVGIIIMNIMTLIKEIESAKIIHIHFMIKCNIIWGGIMIFVQLIIMINMTCIFCIYYYSAYIATIIYNCVGLYIINYQILFVYN